MNRKLHNSVNFQATKMFQYILEMAHQAECNHVKFDREWHTKLSEIMLNLIVNVRKFDCFLQSYPPQDTKSFHNFNTIYQTVSVLVAFALMIYIK